ncbi:hypothetical protein J5U18_00075 [Sphingobacteriaceae bacterium WQ 2009]|uniref:Uncharacterized protein n=1 Tax=Rhinopithecimicrobium faecis TaxID=2820698 RepID=A0A8T4H493_9SPHI|nr:hypothetical protein [Sphingobacteriaceae bacterium WQ 2009]
MGKFKIGDLVRFVDEPIEGHITSFQKNDLIGVTDDTGFEIPVLASKITLVHGNMRREDDELEASAPHIPHKFVEKGILLAIAGEHKDGLARLHIINETSYELLISISEVNGNKVKGIFADKVSINDSVQFYSANFATVGKWPTFRIQILRHSSSTQQFTNPINKEQRIRPVDLTNQKVSNELLGERIWYYEIDKEDEDIGIEKLKTHFIPHRPK